MLVKVDEAWKDGATGAIDDLLRRAVDLSQGDNAPVLYEEVAGHQTTRLVLSDNEATAKQ